MRLALLTIAVLVAFAANSVLNRLGVAVYHTDATVFAVVRTAAGVVVHWTLVAVQGRGWPSGRGSWRIGAALALAVYMAGFSLAYRALDAGVGALILFGGVQITMFGGALFGGERVERRRSLGAVLALVGLAVLVWPDGGASVPLSGTLSMFGAAVGWGIYSLMGRHERDPLAATAANFLICLPIVLPLLIVGDGRWTGGGIVLAIIAGGVTSGLGYALWYAVVPALGATRAAVAQLSVPVIAAAGGVAFLAEPVTLTFAISAGIVIGGIGLSLSGGPRRGAAGAR